MTLEEMGMIAFCFRNDLHCAHHNMRGTDFLDTHELFGSYYNKALEDYDYFIEHAILTEEIKAAPNATAFLKNPNEVSGKWEPITGLEEMSVNDAWSEFVRIGEDYLFALDSCRDYCEKEDYNDICSDIDAIRSFWSLEINYKGKKSITK